MANLQIRKNRSILRFRVSTPADFEAVPHFTTMARLKPEGGISYDEYKWCGYFRVSFEVCSPRTFEAWGRIEQDGTIDVNGRRFWVVLEEIGKSGARARQRKKAGRKSV